MLTDEQLMQQVQKGKKKALGTLFERYQQPLYSYFVRMSRDKMWSEDLVQEVFERVWTYKHSFQINRSFKAWLYQLARNVCLKQINRAKKTPVQALGEWQISDESANANDCLENKETLQQLEYALAVLSKSHREILLLTRYTDMKYTEVAELLDCSVSAVKVRVFRAMQQLRKQFHKIDSL